MLDGLRGFAKSWPGKIMGAFLLVGVAGFGINNVILDLGSNTVGRVGNEEISSREFLRMYQNQLNTLSQRMGTVPSTSQAAAMGLPSSVLLRLANDAAIDSIGSDLGLGVSDAKLGELTRQDPSFSGTLGAFEPQVFRQVLQQSGWTEAEYFDARANDARREQLTLALFDNVKQPAVANTLINNFANATRSIDYIALTDANVETPAAPTDEELNAYLTQYQSEFRTVETRKVRIFDLSAPALAKNIEISEDEITAEYERNSASLTTPERRTIQQVALNTSELQSAFKDGLAAGTSFADIVAATGVTPTTLGTMARTQITDSRLAEAAFGLPADGFVIIPGIGGERAVHVSAIEAEAQVALDTARQQIRDRLATARARNELNTILDQVEELRAAFQPLDQIGERFNLPVYEIDVTASGAELAEIPNLANEDRTRVTQAIFAAQPDRLIPSIPVTGNGHIWFDLVEVSPARDQTLDEVRPNVEEAILAQKTNDALLALGADIVSRLDAGETLSDIALSLSTFPQISSAFTRFGSEDGTIDAVVATEVFNGGPGHAGTVVSGTGEFIVFEVLDETAPAAGLDATIQASIDTEAQNDLFGEFVAAVRDDAGLRVNQQAMNDLIVQNFGQ